MSDATDIVSAMGGYQAANAAAVTALETQLASRGGRQRSNSTPTPTPAPTGLFGPAGFNVGFSQLDYSGSGFPFLDRFKSSEWRNNGYGEYTDYNANRYPNAITGGGSNVLHCLVNVEGPLGPAGVQQRYVLRTNKLDMVFSPLYATTVSDTTANGVRTMVLDAPNPLLDSAYRIELTVTSLPTPFSTSQYITMVRADQQAAFDGGEVFSPQFLSRFSLVQVIRMMDWIPANHPYQTVWADRPKLSWGSWTSARGVPLEIMVALANRTNRHLYVNIPVQVDDAYVDQMAALIDGSLASGLLCGVEYGNENWNFIFPQYGYLANLTPYPTRADFEPNGSGEYQDYERSWIQSGLQGTRKLGRFMKAVSFSTRFVPLWCTQAVGITITNRNELGVVRAIQEWSTVGNARYDAALAARYGAPGELYTGGLGITSYFHANIALPDMSAADKATVKGWAQASNNTGYEAALRQLEFGDVLQGGAQNSLAGFASLMGAQIAAAERMQMPWFCYEGNIELPSASGNLAPNGSADDTLTRDFYNRLFDYSGMRGLFYRVMKKVWSLGGYLNDLLTDFGTRGDTYATLNSAYGAITQRGLGLQDFAADRGPSRTLTVQLSTNGGYVVGASPVTTIKVLGGTGPVTLSVTGMAPGRSFRFRTINGQLTTVGSTTLSVTATDAAGNTATATEVQNVAAAPVGFRYFRLRAIGPADQPTSTSYASGAPNPPSLSEITFKTSGGATVSMASATISGDQNGNGNETVQKLIDGSTATYWVGVTGKTNVVVLDFGSGGAAKPATVTFTDRGDLPTWAPGDFGFDVSNDGSAWTQVYRTIERGGTTPGNAVYNPNAYTGSYDSHVFTFTPTYP